MHCRKMLRGVALLPDAPAWQHQRLCLSLAAAACCAAASIAGAAAPASAAAHKPPTSAEVLAASAPSDWRTLDPRNTLYLELPGGRVIIELAPAFAPHHVANVEALAREGYFDGLWIMRSQDNYVVQWGDPDEKKPIRTAQRTLPAEFERPLRDLNMLRLADPDTYAPQTGFVEDFPAAADPALAGPG